MKVKGLGFALLLWGVSTWAQQLTVGISGTLLDPYGQPILNSEKTVTAKNTSTQAEFTTMVSPNGEYRLSGLPPGSYDLTVPTTGPMYAAFTQSGVILTVAEIKMDLHIDWGTNGAQLGDDPSILLNDIRRKAKVQPGPTPRMPDGKPDLSGFWVNVTQPGLTREDPPLQPWAAEIQRKLLERPEGRQGPATYCLPRTALPFTVPFPFKIVQTPKLIVHISESDTPGYRQIFLDGRSHPKEWNPSWLGHSIGTWEADTLVIDTVGFNEMAGGVGVHTERLHVVERVRRPDLGHLEVDMTVEDPAAYTSPFERSVRSVLAPDEEILEFVCAENNKDPLHFGGLGYYRAR